MFAAAATAADFTPAEINHLTSWGRANRLEIAVEALGSDCANEVVYIGQNSGTVS